MELTYRAVTNLCHTLHRCRCSCLLTIYLISTTQHNLFFAIMPINRTPSGILAALLLLLLPRVSEATKSFFYNNDMFCSYPFELTINAITCTDSDSWAYVSNEYNDNNQNRNADDGLCWFGQTMDIEGEVTLMESVYRYFTAKLHVCYQNQGYGFYKFRSFTKCFTYTKKIDLMAVSTSQQAQNSYDEAAGQEDEEQEQEQENQYQYQYRYNQQTNYLSAGTHEFQTRLTIPNKSFTFKEGWFFIYAADMCLLVVSLFNHPHLFARPSFSIMTGYIVKAEITFYPEEVYHGAGSYYHFESYNYKTVCHTTFTAGDDEYVDNTNNRYEYWAVGGLVTCFAAAAALYGAKRRRLLVCFDQEPTMEDSDMSDDDGQKTNFQKMVELQSVQA